jgi:hypothetical protein
MKCWGMPDPNLLPKLDHCPNLPPNLHKELADELAVLRKRQILALQTAAYIVMSTKEANEYEQRRARIQAISKQFGRS